MKVKLTLSMEPDVIEKVKRLARREGVSVSALFEKWSSHHSKAARRSALGTRLRGKWRTDQTAPVDPRLDYLLHKHGDR